MAAEDRPDSGETLVEVTISILIMGIVFVAIMAGFATSIGISVIHKNQATEQTIARDFGEYLQYSDKVPYQNCGSAADYNGALTNFADRYTLPDGSQPLVGSPPNYTVTMQPVRYWDGNHNPATFVTACGPDNGAQRFAFTVTSATEPLADQSLQVVKRK